jgi:muconolactone delta-isomerase
VIRGRRYQTLVKTYGAVDPYGCNNEYGFQILPMPTHNTDTQKRPWGEYLERGDDWNTEHVLDAQVVGKFLEYIMDDQPIQARIGRNVLTENGKLKKVTTEEWLAEFWVDRTDNGLSALSQLLAEYPGTDFYTDELTLLGRHINTAKQSVFGGKKCISREWWTKHTDFSDRIDQLRYCIFLSRVSLRSHCRTYSNLI